MIEILPSFLMNRLQETTNLAVLCVSFDKKGPSVYLHFFHFAFSFHFDCSSRINKYASSGIAFSTKKRMIHISGCDFFVSTSNVAHCRSRMKTNANVHKSHAYLDFPLQNQYLVCNSNCCIDSKLSNSLAMIQLFLSSNHLSLSCRHL